MDRKANTAIKIHNRGLKAAATRCEDGFVWVELEEELMLCSCYVSPNVENEALEEYLGKVGTKIREVKPKNIIVCGDFNAKSTR